MNISYRSFVIPAILINIYLTFNIISLTLGGGVFHYSIFNLSTFVTILLNAYL